MTSNAQGVLKSLVYTSGSNILIRLCSFFGYILLLKALTVHDYGVFVLLASTVGPAMAIALFSFDRIFVSVIAEARGRGDLFFVRKISREYIFVVVGLTLVLLAGGYIAKTILETVTEMYLFQFFGSTALLVVSQIFSNITGLLLESRERFKEISIIGVAEASVRFVCIVVMLLVGDLSVSLVLVAYAMGKIISSLYGVWCLQSPGYEMQSSAPYQGSVLLPLVKNLGKWEIIRSVVEQIMQPLKLLIVKFFVTVDGVAALDFAKNFYSFATEILPIKRILFPLVSRLSNVQDMARVIAKSQKYLLFSYAILFLGICVGAPIVVALVFPQYQSFTYLTWLIALHMFVDVYKLGQEALVYTFKEQKFVTTRILPISFFMQITFDTIATYFFGLVGYVMVSHLYTVVLTYLTGRHLRKKFHSTYSLRYFFSFDDYDRLLFAKIKERLLKKKTA